MGRGRERRAWPRPGLAGEGRGARVGRPVLTGGVGSLHGVGANIVGLAAGVWRRRSHALSSGLWHARGGWGHVVGAPRIRASARPRSQASSGGHRPAGLARTLAVHWAAGVHAQAVAHAGARPAVAGTGGPSIVRGPGVVPWGAVLASLRPVGGGSLLVGPVVHGASWRRVGRHGGSRLLGPKLGARGIPLHGRWEPSLLGHGRLTQGGMGAHV